MNVKEAGRRGGLKRAEVLSAERKREIALIANKASLRAKQLKCQSPDNGENKNK